MPRNTDERWTWRATARYKGHESSNSGYCVTRVAAIGKATSWLDDHYGDLIDYQEVTVHRTGQEDLG